MCIHNNIYFIIIVGFYILALSFCFICFYIEFKKDYYKKGKNQKKYHGNKKHRTDS